MLRPIEAPVNSYWLPKLSHSRDLQPLKKSNIKRMQRLQVAFPSGCNFYAVFLRELIFSSAIAPGPNIAIPGELDNSDFYFELLRWLMKAQRFGILN